MLNLNRPKQGIQLCDGVYNQANFGGFQQMYLKSLFTVNFFKFLACILWFWLLILFQYFFSCYFKTWSYKKKKKRWKAYRKSCVYVVWYAIRWLKCISSHLSFMNKKLSAKATIHILRHWERSVIRKPNFNCIRVIKNSSFDQSFACICISFHKKFLLLISCSMLRASPS